MRKKVLTREVDEKRPCSTLPQETEVDEKLPHGSSSQDRSSPLVSGGLTRPSATVRANVNVPGDNTVLELPSGHLEWGAAVGSLFRGDLWPTKREADTGLIRSLIEQYESELDE